MFYYTSEEGETNMLPNDKQLAMNELKCIARDYLHENNLDSVKYCLIDFENNKAVLHCI